MFVETLVSMNESIQLQNPEERQCPQAIRTVLLRLYVTFCPERI